MEVRKLGSWMGAMLVAVSATATVQAQSSGAAAHAAHAKPLRLAHGWTLVDLGTLGGPGSYATALTNGGLVVGCADVPGTGAHAFVYQSGVMRDLGTGTATSDGSSCAYAANDTGTVAGRAASGELVDGTYAGVTHLGLQGPVGG